MLTFNALLPYNTLEAVNLALTYMREQRVDDLSLINQSFPVQKAYGGLLQQTRAELTRGWFFNTKTVTLTPDANGNILFASNVVDAIPDRQDVFTDSFIPVCLNGRLVNAYDQSDVFTAPITLRLRYLLNFEQMPEVFRRYVALKNASLCGQEVDEAIGLSAFHQREFQEAEAERMELELRASPVNFYSTIYSPT